VGGGTNIAKNGTNRLKQQQYHCKDCSARRVLDVIGDRREKTRRRLWNKVPIEYHKCISYGDFWDAYRKVLPQKTHYAVGKESGQTSHVERWYCTLRQLQARYVRTSPRYLREDIIVFNA
jgi:IS1 family transposase